MTSTMASAFGGELRRSRYLPSSGHLLRRFGRPRPRDRPWMITRHGESDRIKVPGADLSSNGNAAISFTIEADELSIITVDSLTVDFTSGGACIWQIQEAGAAEGAQGTVNFRKSTPHTWP